MSKFLFCLLFIVLFLFPNSLFGQSITGTILSANDSLPVVGASIRIVGMDSKLIQGVISSTDGMFEATVEKNSQFQVIVSSVGFSTEQIEIKGIKGNMNLGKVFLKEDVLLLDEVVVKADNIINKVDKSIVIPTSIQLKVSNSSLGLLQNLNLPGLYVDELEQKVNINGSQPIFMIDGVIKTKRDFLSINPKNIARVEYESYPSIRNMDNNAGGVIHVILKRKENGGNFWGNVTGSPSTGFLNTDIYFAYNWAKSELSVNYFNNWRDYTHRWTDKEEKYVTSTNEIKRSFKGTESPFGYLNQGVYLNYTYQPNKNTMFSATFRNDFGKQHTSVNGDVEDSHKALPFYRDSKSAFDSYIPALDLFFKRNLRKGQSLEINMVGTVQHTGYERILKDKADVLINNISNEIDNSRQSLISEVVYRKQFEKINLNLGYQNKISYSKNKYNNVSETEERLSENNNYIYGSVSGSIKKFSYYLGTGMKLFTIEDDIDKKLYVKKHSALTLMYNANNNFSIKMSSFYTPHLPSLSQLSNVTQIYDEILQMKGNPELKAAYTIGTKLFADYQIKNFNSNMTVGFQRMVNTIYIDVQPLEGNTFISQPKNAIGDNRFNFEWKCSYMGLLNHINLYSTIGFSSFTSEGSDYKHRLNNFYWDFSAQVYWGKWTFSAYYVKPQKSLRAQTIDFGENNSQISLGFKHKNLNLFAAVKYPFVKNGWQWSEENLSKVNPGKTSVFVKDNGSMFLLGATYSFNFGKGLNKLSKKINNSDNTTSILKVQE